MFLIIAFAFIPGQSFSYWPHRELEERDRNTCAPFCCVLVWSQYTFGERKGEKKKGKKKGRQLRAGYEAVSS